MIDWQKRGAASSNKNLKLILYLFMTFIAVGAVLLIAFFPNSNSTPALGVSTCGDDSFYNSCSLDKPYYCYKGILTENVLSCGCPSVMIAQGLNCISKYQSGLKSFNFTYVLDGNNGNINFSLYNGLDTYLSTLPESMTYSGGQQPLRADFKLMRIDEPNQEALLMPLIKEIENLAPHDKVDQARIAISLIQNIPWGPSGKTVTFGGKQVNYSRYPYQVLYDNQGLCGEKSELLALILKNLGYGVVLFYYPKENHESLGIKCPVEYSVEGTGYCFVETTGPSIISDNSIVFVGGVTLSPSPEIIFISRGISLPGGLYEYDDAKTLEGIRSRGTADSFSSPEYKRLEAKYGLSKVYNIG